MLSPINRAIAVNTVLVLPRSLFLKVHLKPNVYFAIVICCLFDPSETVMLLLTMKYKHDVCHPVF